MWFHFMRILWYLSNGIIKMIYGRMHQSIIIALIIKKISAAISDAGRVVSECSSGVDFNYYVTSQHYPSYKYFFAIPNCVGSLRQEPLVWNAGSAPGPGSPRRHGFATQWVSGIITPEYGERGRGCGDTRSLSAQIDTLTPSNNSDMGATNWAWIQSRGACGIN